MNIVRVIPQPAAIAKLIMTGGAIAKVACHAPAVVKFVSVGTQGIQGLSGALAFDRIANVLLGQTLFNLLLVPASPDKCRMVVNGTFYGPPLISVAGQQVTWTEPFTLEPSDSVEFQYPVSEIP